MDEEQITRAKKSTHRRGETDSKIKKNGLGDKLKNDASRKEAMGKKFRTGKADTKETITEKKKREKLRKQGRKKAYEEAIRRIPRGQATESDDQDNNASEDVLVTTHKAVQNTLYSGKIKNHDKRSKGYASKIHERKHMEEAKSFQKAKDEIRKNGTSSKEIQKNLMKKEIQRYAYKKQTVENANSFGNISKRFVDKAEDMASRIAEAVTEFVESHPLGSIMAVIILILVLVLSGILSSCAASFGGGSNLTVATSYTAQDSDIVAVNDNYKDLESALRNRIDNIETTYPDYDEYKYQVAEINHNPYALAALLTVLYEDYTESEVQAMLQTIFDTQYVLTMTPVTETRTREEERTGYRTVHHEDGTTSTESYTYTVEVEYEYHILKVKLVNKGIDYVARNMGLTAEQLQRYEILLTTFGNKKYLFEGENNAVPNPGDYPDYQVSSENLTDQQFAKMLEEAKKYLGYPYVWGGSSPSTSFDCSGFVSYVINHCGNGWNVGRQTANGILGCCARVSKEDAKPGDLIFFQGTYDTSGASHVGIIVDSQAKMMIHCGNPIQYASYDSNYWRLHYYTCGRLNH